MSDPIRTALALAAEVIGDLADEVREHPDNAPWFSPTRQAHMAELARTWQQLLEATAAQPAFTEYVTGPPSVRALLSEFKDRHEALHRAWTAAVGAPGYVKAPWRDRDNALTAEYRERAEALGYVGPLLPAGGAR